ncbi:hypothetical protein NN561_002005 [Cricetulus griseus]
MPALFRLLNSPVERGPISCCHSRIIYTSQVRALICSEAVGPKPAEARGFLAEASNLASNVTRPGRSGGTSASNIEQQRHLVSTCSNAIRLRKSQQRSQAELKGGKLRGRSL